MNLDLGRWMGSVDATLDAHRSDLDRHGERLDDAERHIVDVRLDVRGLLVRVSLFAAIAAAVACALLTPAIYLALAHFGVATQSAWRP